MSLAVSDKLVKAYSGKSNSQGGLNIDQFKQELSSLFPEMVERINKAKLRDELYKICREKGLFDPFPAEDIRLIQVKISAKAHSINSDCLLIDKIGCELNNLKITPIDSKNKLDPVISEKCSVLTYPNSEILVKVCKSFEKQEIILTSTFMGKIIPIVNCNAVGDILEDVFYPMIKDKLGDFEEGPKQSSPDYYGNDKSFEFEQKLFMNNPCFDIGNFTSYVNMLSENGGVYKKLFKTKYLIFEYSITDDKIKIIKFHYLNVYNLVGYSGKNPMTMQIKNKVWYNIRPTCVTGWYSPDKNPQLFIDKII